MRKKKWMLAAILICGATTVLNSCKDKDDDPAPVNPVDSKETDYSQKSSWHQIPEITKEFDTFYIPATNYDGYEDGDPTFVPIDNAEFVAGVTDENEAHASVYAASTNVFVPYYRQSSLKYEEECWKKTCSMFSQSYFNAPAIRMSENQTKAGGKIYTYFYTPESILPIVG